MVDMMSAIMGVTLRPSLWATVSQTVARMMSPIMPVGGGRIPQRRSGSGSWAMLS